MRDSANEGGDALLLLDRVARGLREEATYGWVGRVEME